MAMFAFSNAILSMGTRTGELGKSTLLRKKTTQHVREILAS
jgi:hypothetical protein